VLPVTPHAHRLEGRIVVVSPHLDDAVLSLGATMWTATRRGARIELLTVFGCDPESEATAGGWDRRGGFRTEGESARARREEDRLACAILGVRPVWLPFGSVDYERHGADEDVVGSILDAVEGADVVLLPGSPLTHPDHLWFGRALVGERTLSPGRVAWYAEQPYTRRTGTAPSAPGWLVDELGDSPTFERLHTSPRAGLAKWRAIREYRSQLSLLGMRRSARRGPLSLVRIPEAVAWNEVRGRGRD
jgi:LmbE family N-acetylglucosaminyl deacetylase